MIRVRKNLKDGIYFIATFYGDENDDKALLERYPPTGREAKWYTRVPGTKRFVIRVGQ